MPKYTEYYEDPNKLIQEYGLYTSDQTLNEDIRSCFSTDEWVKKDVFEGELDEELSYEWNYFVEMVKHKKKYWIYSKYPIIYHFGCQNITRNINFSRNFMMK